jgi:hypothetical protein
MTVPSPPLSLQYRVWLAVIGGVAAGLAVSIMLVFLERIRSLQSHRHDAGDTAVLLLVELAAQGQLVLPLRVQGVSMRQATADERTRVQPEAAPALAWPERPGLPGVVLLGRLPTAEGALLWQMPDGRVVVAQSVAAPARRGHEPPFPWIPLIAATVVASACAALATQGVARSLRAIRDAAERAGHPSSARCLPPSMRCSGGWPNR